MDIRIWIGLATTLAALPMAALARDRGEPVRPGQSVQRRDVPQMPAEAPPAVDRRMYRGDAGNDGRARYFASPEERQQLRRDINAAGRDLYRRHKEKH